VLYVEVPQNLLKDVNFLIPLSLEGVAWGPILQMAVALAIVASAETLLCATAVDQMHQGQRTQYDRELAAQGIGNMICGLLGALPMTGVIVRSSANIQAGATTRLSAVLHGLWLLLFVVALGAMLRMIPTASLAAILVYTGYKLVNLKAMKKLWQCGKSEAAIYAATVVTIVVVDLLSGVILGVVLSAVKLLHAFSRLTIDLKFSDFDQKSVLSLDGTATFISLPKLAAALEGVPKNAELHVDLQHLAYIDHACLELLMTWAKQHESVGGNLVIDWDSLHAKVGRDPFRREATTSVA
jgi:MFS superfamily sulfate permease-like transporter